MASIDQKKTSTMLWVVLVLVAVTLVATIFWKDKVQLVDEEGNAVVGTSGKLNKSNTSEDEE